MGKKSMAVVAALALALALALSGCSRRPPEAPPAPANAAQALERLAEGNRAYLENQRNPAQLTPEHRADTAENGQRPYAVIVTCSDSRVPPEHIFSAGLGELFIIRTAGNVLDDIAIGSVAYGAEHLQAPLILVLGHSGCGAVAAALEGGAHGSIAAVTDEIQGCIGQETDPAACEILNVQNSLGKLLADDIISQLVREGQTQALGAIYDIHSGQVEFLD